MKIFKHTHKGQRDNQEDAYGLTNNTFIVCDGVGGNTKGEVASNFIVEEILRESKSLEIFSKNNIQELLSKVQQRLNSTLVEHPEREKMGTTFCGVFINKEELFFGHIGDSRIYWIRPSLDQIWHTWDHSLVGHLVKSGVINREQGRNHPLGNRIERAIVGNSENNIARVEVTNANQLLKGDIIFICTDGINEAWNEYDLMRLLCDEKLSSEEKSKLVAENCILHSRDNNTFLLMEIENGEKITAGKNEEILWISLRDFKDDIEDENENDPYHTSILNFDNNIYSIKHNTSNSISENEVNNFSNNKETSSNSKIKSSDLVNGEINNEISVNSNENNHSQNVNEESVDFTDHIINSDKRNKRSHIKQLILILLIFLICSLIILGSYQFVKNKKYNDNHVSVENVKYTV